MQTIFDKLKECAIECRSRWHTPGHKGLLSKFDLTEIDDSFPSDCIQRAEARAAKIFGAKGTKFLTGGSSMGIKAGLMSLEGDFLIESGCHCAIKEALTLSQKKATVIQNTVKSDLMQPLTAHQIDEALTSNPDIKTVVVTSPDYYGQTADGQAILEVVRRHGARLYVDAAHGAHFSFRPDLFPPSATSYADICNISAHKTMPAFTQSAYLCYQDEDLGTKIQQNLQLLGTTSPSYLLLAGLEYALDYTERNSSRFDELYKSIAALKKDIKCLQNDDFTRIVVDAEHYGKSGKDLYFDLKKQGVVAEKFDARYVVFIASICDDDQKIQALGAAIKKASTK